MKTFKNLCIGDFVYRIVEDYYLGNPEKEQIEKISVKWIDFHDNKLRINEFRGYSNTDYLLILSDTFQNATAVEYGKRTFFTNPEDANRLVAKAVKEKIDNFEKSIPAFIESTNDKIETLRSTFYEILNPSYNEDFKILTD